MTREEAWIRYAREGRAAEWAERRGKVLLACIGTCVARRPKPQLTVHAVGRIMADGQIVIRADDNNRADLYTQAAEPYADKLARAVELAARLGVPCFSGSDGAQESNLDLTEKAMAAYSGPRL